jgi:Flp pilus assembly protein TadD
MAKQVARGVYQRALALLREGATRLPDNAELQYHLGMAAVGTGDKDLARKALAFAAGSPAAFKGKDEARRALAELR